MSERCKTVSVKRKSIDIKSPPLEMRRFEPIFDRRKRERGRFCRSNFVETRRDEGRNGTNCLIARERRSFDKRRDGTGRVQHCLLNPL
jgi:hypothetical protein